MTEPVETPGVGGIDGIDTTRAHPAGCMTTGSAAKTTGDVGVLVVLAAAGDAGRKS